jgi:hypothetical protein
MQLVGHRLFPEDFTSSKQQYPREDCLKPALAGKIRKRVVNTFAIKVNQLKQDDAYWKRNLS